jgi:heterotetrameric sarcosine oxidase gamma subunit
MSDTDVFPPRSALAGAATPPDVVMSPNVLRSPDVAISPDALRHGAGLLAVVRDGLGFASVLERRLASDALTGRVRERFGVELPGGPRLSSGSDIAFVGLGPGAWLAMAERGGSEFAVTLMRELDGVASVADQSDGYVLVRLSGPRVRNALTKLIPIDLHPRAFSVGDAVSTVASHIGVTLWRLADEFSAPVFEVTMFRSLAPSFWHALNEAGVEYGVMARLS